MTLDEAKAVFRMLNRENLSEEDFFLFTEAGDFIIEKTGDPAYMLKLGGAYYAKREFEPALRYYEMAAEKGYETAFLCLGYIWYYGRTGKTDYEKAYRYFSSCPDNVNALYKIADMYKNGYFVPQNEKKYREIIEQLYDTVNRQYDCCGLRPEIFVRLARIRMEDGKNEEAIALFRKARKKLAQRITDNPFFGNLSIMKHLIIDLYKLMELNQAKMDLFDLYELLRKPAVITFRYDGKPYTVRSVEENGSVVIQFQDKWYRDTDDFFENAAIGGDHLTVLFYELLDFEVK